jgi:hypothetical protein
LAIRVSANCFLGSHVQERDEELRLIELEREQDARLQSSVEAGLQAARQRVLADQSATATSHSEAGDLRADSTDEEAATPEELEEASRKK